MNRLCRDTWFMLPYILFFFSCQVFADESNGPVRVDPALVSSAGILLNASHGGKFMPWCTVSLTRSNTVLTANHCVTSIHAGDTLKVFFPYEGIRDVNLESSQTFCFESHKTEKQNDSEECSLWIDDLAILRLSTPYSLLRPLKLGSSSVTNIGSRASIAGFGSQDLNQYRYGTKHEGEIVISDCGHGSDPANSSSADNARALCFQFDRSDSDGASIGPFDSGGPMLSVHMESGEKTLIGVARSSDVITDSTGNIRMAKYVNLTDPFYRTWLAGEVFSDDFIPPDFLIDKLTTDKVQNLKPKDQADYSYHIGQSASRLILTLNHEPGPSMFPNNLDLKLPGSLQANCDRYDSVEVCSVENPAAGTYRVSVVWGKQCRSDGQCTDPIYDAAYQMTAIALYDNPFVSAVGNTGARNKQSHNE